MKKEVLLLLFIISFCTFSAQVFRVGAMTGLSGSQVEGDGYAGYNKLGFILGGFTNVEHSENFSTQLEMYFINKGSQKNPNPSAGDNDAFNLNLNYIEIPLALRYHYKAFVFEAGPYYSVFLNYSMSDEFGNRNDQPFPFKKYDFGGFLGLQYQLNDHFGFNLRSKNSILPVRDFQNLDQQVGILNKLFNRGWYNLDLNFTIRYQINK